MTRPSDLRSYLAALEAIGDIDRIDRLVDADLEAAAVTRLSTERGAPAPLLESIRGFEGHVRMFGAAGALSSTPDTPFARVALSMGQPPETGGRDLVEHLVAARARQPMPPRLVARADAPCKENVLLGERATLDDFPVPRVHPADGGKYVNT